MYKYIKISEESLEELEKLEGTQNLEYEKFNSALEIVEEEEAEFRLRLEEGCMGKTIEDLNLRDSILYGLKNAISNLDYIDNDKLQDETVDVIMSSYPQFYFSEPREEIERLISEDYAARAIDPHFIIANGEVSWYSNINGQLFKDSSFSIAAWLLTQEEAKKLMLKYGFKELKVEELSK